MTAVEHEGHPYARAWHARENATLFEALAPDVLMWSPILREPFQGRDTAMELFEVLFRTFETFDITSYFQAERSHVFRWSARVGDRTIEGIDLIRHDRDDRIDEIRIYIRPLAGIGDFAAAFGAPLARRRGRGRGAIARSVGALIPPLFKLIDVIADRLTKRPAAHDDR